VGDLVIALFEKIMHILSQYIFSNFSVKSD